MKYLFLLLAFTMSLTTHVSASSVLDAHSLQQIKKKVRHIDGEIAARKEQIQTLEEICGNASRDAYISTALAGLAAGTLLGYVGWGLSFPMGGTIAETLVEPIVVKEAFIYLPAIVVAFGLPSSAIVSLGTAISQHENLSEQQTKIINGARLLTELEAKHKELDKAFEKKYETKFPRLRDALSLGWRDAHFTEDMMVTAKAHIQLLLVEKEILMEVQKK